MVRLQSTVCTEILITLRTADSVLIEMNPCVRVQYLTHVVCFSDLLTDLDLVWLCDAHDISAFRRRTVHDPHIRIFLQCSLQGLFLEPFIGLGIQDSPDDPQRKFLRTSRCRTTDMEAFPSLDQSLQMVPVAGDTVQVRAASGIEKEDLSLAPLALLTGGSCQELTADRSRQRSRERREERMNE